MDDTRRCTSFSKQIDIFSNLKRKMTNSLRKLFKQSTDPDIRPVGHTAGFCLSPIPANRLDVSFPGFHHLHF
ncbi:hypothetical protein THOG11_10442 [Vibrio harveyi]|nr:hypothetical protein TH15OA1_200250 [Vibrio harveyi]CAH1547906.1 hypothetical protein THOD03_10444 [Vibrio harveyi]CAH1549998.1 hypothetical protein THOG11_10442 [Vibrio harveyi]